MKHTESHKLNFACLDCVKKHMEHKERLIRFVQMVADTDFYYDPSKSYNPPILDIEAKELLAEIKADEE